MTFNADTITDVQIDVANETKGYGADIADEMVKKILDAQSSEVDGHSGATITSGAIKKAAESCINQAKGVAVAPTEASKAETVVPEGLTTEEQPASRPAAAAPKVAVRRKLRREIFSLIIVLLAFSSCDPCLAAKSADFVTG